MPVYFSDGGSGIRLIPKEYNDSLLIHYGVKGQKHGVRQYQYEDGSLTPLGYIHYGINPNKQQSKQQYTKTDTVFISGKVKYDKPISGKIKKEIKNAIKANSKIVIGDAPGADTRVQQYLSKKGYKNVEVYTTDSEVRNNVGGWKVNKIDASKYTDEKEARAQKDIAMTKVSNKGIAISSEDDRPDSATSKNIQRMAEQGSSMIVYDYKTKKFLKDGMEIKVKEYEEKYHKQKESAEKEGNAKADSRIAELESMKDGPEKSKKLEELLKDCDDDHKEHNRLFSKLHNEDGLGFGETHSVLGIVENMNPKHHEIVKLWGWMFNQITSKSGDWYSNVGVSKGFKDITNQIDKLFKDRKSINQKIYEKYSNYFERKKAMDNDPRLKQITQEIKDLHDKMPAQVLKDLGMTVSEENIERIKPFVFWD